ncbi:MAG TPA: phosphotransferase [Deltaproteobacteria bacterium]|nr:phosphotransferase [Deltaproteobacteria bacterium]
MRDHATLVEFMSDPSSYPEPTGSVEVVQTHISWVFVCDEFVYKVKKPVDFGFLDFTTLDKRRFYTEEELRLNRRFSPEVYLEVVPVSLKGGRFILGDGSYVVEYALKMRRISEDCMLHRLLAGGLADEAMLGRVGLHLARIYGGIPSTEEARRYGSVETVSFNVNENFEQTARYVGGPVTASQYDEIRSWSLDFLDRKQAVFDSRQKLGWIKECHGDLHLQHICVDREKIFVFDCIEFNERFRYGDVASDVAFLSMDLDYNSRTDLSKAFVEGYLAGSKDTGLLDVLRFYKVYRAYVRAKVTSFMLDDEGLEPPLKEEAMARASRYYALAHRYVMSAN